MALADKWCGPFTVTYKDFAAGTEAFAGLKRDTGVLSIIPNTISEDFETGDGCEVNGGFTTELTLTFSDVIPADMDTIIGYNGSVTVLLAKSGKTITFPGTALIPNFHEVTLLDGKVQVKTICRWPLATTFATMFQITGP